MKIIGYADRFSVQPGETIRFMVSAQDIKTYRADIVRLIHGDTNPAGPGYKEEEIATPISGSYRGRHQPVRAGSYLTVPRCPQLDNLKSFTVAAMIWPTTPRKGRQALVTHWHAAPQKGWALVIDEDGSIALMLGHGGKTETLRVFRPLLPREWYCVGASFEAHAVTVWQRPLASYPGVDHGGQAAETSAKLTIETSDMPLVMAAWVQEIAGGWAVMGGHYNGKIDAVRLFDRVVAPDAAEQLVRDNEAAIKAEGIVGAWDFAKDMTTTRIRDLSPNRLDGEIVNLPARAMKGWNWAGEEMSWQRAPEQYGAIHFHDDDIYDCGWQSDFSLRVPDSFRSGIYAARLSAGEHEDYIPFYVRPRRGSATADIAFLAPTANYMAYANDHNSVDGSEAEMVIGRLVALQPQDLHIMEHRELGGALYDKHSDGSGVCYSSRLRPILNMRPKYASWLGATGSGLWQFNADLHLIDWLEAKGFSYDVITDEDLHVEGYDLLKRYRTVLTGSHPEYHSRRMLDAIKEFTERGGRLMYLGANGFYWRIAFHGELPGVIEVRRAEGGIRTWAAEPGEYYHSFTGEYGGLWRRNGRPPQALVGAGFTAQGFDICSYYRRKPDSFNPRAAFIFEGIGTDERIGDFGLVGNGAAGLEIDRADGKLGTPPHALVLASSEGHTDLYMVVCEEILVNTPNLTGSQSDLVRADMVFYEMPGGGAVFSTSSIAWMGSLSHNGYDNNVSRLTENVLRRFADQAPFPSPGA
jgi:N,N-dimethylformamidase